MKCFYDDLQDLLSGIPPNDLFFMLGDLNAHVGVQDRSSELLSDMLGCFGIDDRNQAGKDLLNLCDFESTVVDEYLVSERLFLLWDVDTFLQ